MPEDNAKDTAHLFAGSIDRSKLEEMKAAVGDDPERQRVVDELQAQVDAVAESDAAAEEARRRAAGETTDDQAEAYEAGVLSREEVEAAEARPAVQDQSTDAYAPESAPEPSEDLNALSKPELVERANAAGIDTTGKTKAELVQELEAQRGDDYVP